MRGTGTTWRGWRPVGIALWAAAFIALALAGWSTLQVLAGGEWVRWAGAEWLADSDDVPVAVQRLSTISINVAPVLLLAAAAVDFVRRDRAGLGGSWAVAHGFGCALLGIGIGATIAASTVGATPSLPLLALLGGAVCLAIRPVTTRVLASRRAEREHAVAQGATAEGVVEHVDVVTIADVNRWRVTVSYADREGRERRHRATVPFGSGISPKVGDRCAVRYDPQRPGRRAAVSVSAASWHRG